MFHRVIIFLCSDFGVFLVLYSVIFFILKLCLHTQDARIANLEQLGAKKYKKEIDNLHAARNEDLKALKEEVCVCVCVCVCLCVRVCVCGMSLFSCFIVLCAPCPVSYVLYSPFSQFGKRAAFFASMNVSQSSLDRSRDQASRDDCIDKLEVGDSDDDDDDDHDDDDDDDDENNRSNHRIVHILCSCSWNSFFFLFTGAQQRNEASARLHRSVACRGLEAARSDCDCDHDWYV